MAALIYLGLIVLAIVLAVHSFREIKSSKTRQLRRTFRRLRRALLKRMQPAHRDEARELLDVCYRHINAMCAMQEEHEMIKELVTTTEKMYGIKAIEARQRINAFRTSVSSRLAEIFAALSRLSVVADLDVEDPVAALREMSRQIESERYELMALTTPIAFQTEPVGFVDGR